MSIQQEESFGPIIGVQRVLDDAEALELMNDTDYGLTASVYCRDHSRATAILKCLDVGSVYINCCDRVSPRQPWSGRRLSALGSTLGEQGLLAFVQPKAYHVAPC